MIRETIYETVDGEKYSSIQAAVEHENELKFILEEINEKIDFFNDDNHPIDIITDSVEGLYYSILQQIDYLCFEIRIKDRLSNKAWNFLYKKFGNRTPCNMTGRYKSYKRSWFSVDEKDDDEKDDDE